MTPTINYDTQDVARIDIMYADGLIDQFNTRLWNGEDSEYIQERIDNLLRDEFNEGSIDYLIAYDYNGDRLDTRTAEEFFALQEGF